MLQFLYVWTVLMLHTVYTVTCICYLLCISVSPLNLFTSANSDHTSKNKRFITQAKLPRIYLSHLVTFILFVCMSTETTKKKQSCQTVLLCYFCLSVTSDSVCFTTCYFQCSYTQDNVRCCAIVFTTWLGNKTTSMSFSFESVMPLPDWPNLTIRAAIVRLMFLQPDSYVSRNISSSIKDAPLSAEWLGFFSSLHVSEFHKMGMLICQIQMSFECCRSWWYKWSNSIITVMEKRIVFMNFPPFSPMVTGHPPASWCTFYTNQCQI